MQTNPNIILSGNQMAQPQLPDVNAMMQTRTAGLENIYNIEQQRAEQARLEQERQTKAQEDALIKALLPAYTYGIQTGDIEGAGGLVPPEMRGQARPYIDALKGKSPQEVQAALIGSLSSSAAGQEALAAIQRAATIGVQQGQLRVAERKLAQEEAAVGQPKVAFRETDAEGNVRMYDAAGNEIGMLPKAGKPTAPEGTDEATQTERRAASLLDNVVRNAGAVNQVITDAPEAFQPTAAEAAAGFLPWGQQQIKAWEQNPQRKIVYNRMRQSIDALLTLATGAAYTQAQLDAQIGAYMPGFFDEDAVKADKIRALRDRIESEKLNAGRAWTPEQEARANEVFAQFENIVSAMSAGAGGASPKTNFELPEGATTSNW